MKKIFYIIFGLTALILVIVAVRSKKTADIQTLVRDENAVLLADQQPNENNTITVSYAKLAEPGYVVITNSDVDMKTSIVGASEYLSAGEHFHIVVKRIQPRTTTTKKYTEKVSAIIVQDNGDQIFDPNDIVVTIDSDHVSPLASEAIIDEESPDIESITVDGIVTRLEEGGYTVNADSDVFDDSANTNDDLQDDSFVDIDGKVIGDESASGGVDLTPQGGEVDVVLDTPAAETAVLDTSATTNAGE